jgi:hypothetical protein
MTRKLWVLTIVGVLGVSLAIAGTSNTRRASACDDTNKSASATPSCCAQGTKTASTDAKHVHDSMIKSAVVAPGAAPILNIAAFAGMQGAKHEASGCEWCPRSAMTAACGANMSASDCAAHMSASDCAAHMSASECTAHMGQQAGAEKCPFMQQQNAAVTADMKGGCPHATTASVASVEQGNCSASMKAAHEGCAGSMATTASAEHACSQNAATLAAHDGCNGSMATTASAAGASCCGEKTASTAMNEDKCCAATKSASLKGIVDDMPYRENKRVTLDGSYACGHCTLQKTQECAPMLKTADGKVYPLVKNARASELRDVEGKNIQVSGTVKKVDGVKFLEVRSYKVL